MFSSFSGDKRIRMFQSVNFRYLCESCQFLFTKDLIFMSCNLSICVIEVDMYARLRLGLGRQTLVVSGDNFTKISDNFTKINDNFTKILFIMKIKQ